MSSLPTMVTWIEGLVGDATVTTQPRSIATSRPSRSTKKSRVSVGRSDLMLGTALLIVTLGVLSHDRPIAHRARRGTTDRGRTAGGKHAGPASTCPTGPGARWAMLRAARDPEHVRRGRDEAAARPGSAARARPRSRRPRSRRACRVRCGNRRTRAARTGGRRPAAYARSGARARARAHRSAARRRAARRGAARPARRTGRAPSRARGRRSRRRRTHRRREAGRRCRPRPSRGRSPRRPPRAPCRAGTARARRRRPR